jgi:hypothetical protein
VGKGEEMNSAESSCQQGVLTGEREAKERPHSYEDSCGVADHVNEDDEKLNTSITEEEDQRSVLIIGGIQIFLPTSQAEASIGVVDAAERQPGVTVIGEKEQTSESSQVMERDNQLDCHGGEGADIRHLPQQKKKSIQRIAQNFQPGS